MVLLSERLSAQHRWLLYAEVYVFTQGRLCLSPQAVWFLFLYLVLGHSSVLTQEPHQRLFPSILVLTIAAQMDVQQLRAGDGEEGFRWDEDGAGKSGNAICQMFDSFVDHLLSLRYCVSFPLTPQHQLIQSCHVTQRSKKWAGKK